MEGPSIRRFPRTCLRTPVELRVGEQTIHIEKAVGNLSPGGLFVNAGELPVNTNVHVRIAAVHPFEADGVVRFCEPHDGGVGIEFTNITDANRRYLDDLIAELARTELLAS